MACGLLCQRCFSNSGIERARRASYLPQLEGSRVNAWGCTRLGVSSARKKKTVIASPGNIQQLLIRDHDRFLVTKPKSDMESRTLVCPLVVYRSCKLIAFDRLSTRVLSFALSFLAMIIGTYLVACLDTCRMSSDPSCSYMYAKLAVVPWLRQLGEIAWRQKA